MPRSSWRPARSAAAAAGGFHPGNRRTALAPGRDRWSRSIVPKPARGASRVPQARRAALSRDLHRHGGGDARDRGRARAPARASPSAPARRWRSGCRRWRRRWSARRSPAARGAASSRSTSRRWRRSTTCAARAAYRRDAALVLLRRCLSAAGARRWRHDDRVDPVDAERHAQAGATAPPVTRLPPCCATISASPAPRSAATPATAAPARCCSTARRSAPASCRWARRPAARSTTVEGLARDGTLARAAAAFLAHGAAQCGICTPGMLMAAQRPAAPADPRPTRGEVEDALGGVLCRCTGYRKIVEAVLAARAVLPRPAPAAAPARRSARACRALDGVPKVTGARPVRRRCRAGRCALARASCARRMRARASPSAISAPFWRASRPRARC